MTDEELIAVLKEYIPYYELDPEMDGILLSGIKSYAPKYEAGEILGNASSYTKAVRAFLDIEATLTRYYTGVGPSFVWEQKPVQNTFSELPNDWYTKSSYNYAMGKGSFPGCTRSPAEQIVPDGIPARSLAELIKEDLKSKTFCQYCVQITTKCPDYASLAEDQKALCVRTGVDGLGNYQYHLMRLTENGWFHQADNCSVMKYEGDMDPAIDWVLEGTYDGEHWFLTDTIFSGEICYVIYRPDHSVSFEYTGWHNHDDTYHSYQFKGHCPDCGDEQYWQYYRRTSAECPDAPPVSD